MHAALVFLSLLALYLGTMPHTVALEDDGLFILTSYFAGPAHPPGYPLHTLLGYAASAVPFGSVAARVHALSAVLGAGTAALLYALARSFAVPVWIAFTAALAFGASRTFWSQSIIAEVYTLNTFLFCALLLGCVELGRAGPRPDRKTALWIAGVGLAYGLGLSNHWPLILASTPALVVAAWPSARRFLPTVGLWLPALALGLTPYAWLYWRSWQAPQISFYGPIESLEALWFYVSRTGYAAVDFSPSAGFADKLGFLLTFAQSCAVELTGLGLAFAGIGFVTQLGRVGPRVAAALLLAFLANGVGLALLLGFDFDPFHVATFRVYPLIAYLILALWLALGLAWLDERARAGYASLARVPVGALAGLAVTAACLAAHYDANDRSDHDLADRYGRLILSGVSSGGRLYVGGDTETGPVGYLHFIEGVRPDVDVQQRWGLVFRERPYLPLRGTWREQDARLRRLVATARRPVFVTGEPMVEFGSTDYVVLFKVEPRGRPGESTIALPKSVGSFLEDLIAWPDHPDPFSHILRQEVLAGATHRLFRLHARAPPGPDRATLERLLAGASQHFEGKLALAEELLRLEGRDAELAATLAAAERMVDQSLTKRSAARLYRVAGDAQRHAGRRSEAIAAYEHALGRWTHPENDAIEPLLALYAEAGERSKHAELSAWAASARPSTGPSR